MLLMQTLNYCSVFFVYNTTCQLMYLGPSIRFTCMYTTSLVLQYYLSCCISRSSYVKLISFIQGFLLFPIQCTFLTLDIVLRRMWYFVSLFSCLIFKSQQIWHSWNWMGIKTKNMIVLLIPLSRHTLFDHNSWTIDICTG